MLSYNGDFGLTGRWQILLNEALPPTGETALTVKLWRTPQVGQTDQMALSHEIRGMRSALRNNENDLGPITHINGDTEDTPSVGWAETEQQPANLLQLIWVIASFVYAITYIKLSPFSFSWHPELCDSEGSKWSIHKLYLLSSRRAL